MVTFGDAKSMPRPAFPNIESDLSQVLAVAPSVESASRQLGAIMFALRNQERTLGDLADQTKIDTKQMETWLRWLERLQYVVDRNGIYAAKVPVFTSADRRPITRARELMRDIVDPWLAENYPRITAELSPTTPSRSGIPQADTFNMIWSQLLGEVIRNLIGAGMFADPSDPTRRYTGFIPAVYEANILSRKSDIPAFAIAIPICTLSAVLIWIFVAVRSRARRLAARCG
jgi:hypothetical protein